MKLRREWFLVFLSPLVIALAGVGVVMLSRRAPVVASPESSVGESLYREVMDLVHAGYVKEPDLERLVYGAARGIAETLDRHCRVYDGGEWEANRVEGEGRYEGIGITIDRLDGAYRILHVARESPGALAGLKPLDRLLEVDGQVVPFDSPTRPAALDRIRGARDSSVELRVQADALGSEPRNVSVKRGSVEQQTVYGYLHDEPRRIGYLALTAFRGNTTRQFDEVLGILNRVGLSGLILDLRGNRGGFLDVAVEISDRFVLRGVIVSTAGRKTARSHEATGNAPYPKLPLVVLVDGRSASSSEVLAGALQDYGRGVVLGERTYGKGVVQEQINFKSGWKGGLRLTTAHYFTPSGRCIERDVGLTGGEDRPGGLAPDVVVPLDAPTTARCDRLRQRAQFDSEVRHRMHADDDIPDSFFDPHLHAAHTLLVEGSLEDRSCARN